MRRAAKAPTASAPSPASTAVVATGCICASSSRLVFRTGATGRVRLRSVPPCLVRYRLSVRSGRGAYDSDREVDDDG